MTGRELEARRTEVVTLCAGDVPCLSAVNAHFETCFNESYSIMGARNQGGLNVAQLANCINTASGTPFFTAN